MKLGGSLGEFAANLGIGKSNAQRDAEDNIERSRRAYEDLETPDLIEERPEFVEAATLGPSALQGISTDPAFRKVQLEQLGALRNLAQNGGRNAASDADLAEIQQSENQNARGQREAILQNANARGMGGSGAELLAQLESVQAAQNNQSARDMQVRGQNQNTALQAGYNAANIGSNLDRDDYARQESKAQAADAIARYNAGQMTDTNRFNAETGNAAQRFNAGQQQLGYQNKVQKQSGIAGANMGAVGFNQNQANIGAQQAGNILSGAIKLGASKMDSDAKAKQQKSYAGGGRIPGQALVDGDSSFNDFMTFYGAPGEVVVPRTIVSSGSDEDIVDFVRNPPKEPSADVDREAKMQALRSIRARKQ